MVADDGTFSGTSEAVFILGLLSNKLQAPATTNPCQQFYTGTLLGQSVVVAISGYLNIYGSSDQSAGYVWPDRTTPVSKSTAPLQVLVLKHRRCAVPTSQSAQATSKTSSMLVHQVGAPRQAATSFPHSSCQLCPSSCCCNAHSISSQHIRQTLTACVLGASYATHLKFRYSHDHAVIAAVCFTQLGGALNAPGDCAPHGFTTQTRIGDIAVMPFSVNWQVTFLVGALRRGCTTKSGIADETNLLTTADS